MPPLCKCQRVLKAKGEKGRKEILLRTQWLFLQIGGCLKMREMPNKYQHIIRCICDHDCMCIYLYIHVDRLFIHLVYVLQQQHILSDPNTFFCEKKTKQIGNLSFCPFCHFQKSWHFNLPFCRFWQLAVLFPSGFFLPQRSVLDPYQRKN